MQDTREEKSPKEHVEAPSASPSVLSPSPAPPAKPAGFVNFLKSPKVGMLVLAVLLYGLLYLFAWREMRFFLVPSSSMEPTLLRGDYIVTFAKSNYQRGDIVVFWEKQTAEYLAKRIAGLPGDQITVLNGALFINGKYASEPYIAQPMQYTIDRPVLVPEGEVFLLGDNRNNSDDSHTKLQCEPMKDVIGQVRFLYYPYARFGPVNSYPLRNTSGQ